MRWQPTPSQSPESTARHAVSLQGSHRARTGGPRYLCRSAAAASSWLAQVTCREVPGLRRRGPRTGPLPPARCPSPQADSAHPDRHRHLRECPLGEGKESQPTVSVRRRSLPPVGPFQYGPRAPTCHLGWDPSSIHAWDKDQGHSPHVLRTTIFHVILDGSRAP